MRQFVAIMLITIIISAYPMQMTADEEVGIFADPDKTAPDSSGVSEENPFTEESDIFQDSSRTDNSKGISSMYSDLYLKGMEAGENAAKKNTNKLFFFSGFCLGAIGILIPFIIPYDPPMSFLKNKPVDYVMGFKEKYNSTLRSENGKLAVIGLVSFIGAYAFFYIVYFVIMLSVFSGTY